MSNKVRVSVVIPVHNGATYIGRAIDSALDQDVALEVIVIDDGSTDSTAGVLSGYESDDRVRIYKNETKLGVAGTRNRGVSLSEAEYIAFLDADDYWEKNKLRRQIEKMETTGAVLSTTARELITADGTSTGRIIGTPEKIEHSDILRTNFIACSAVVIRRDVMEKYPMEHDDSHEDYISWIRIIKEYGFAVGIDEPLLKYRLSVGGKSRNKLKSARMTYKAYRYCGFSVLRSIRYFLAYAFYGVKKYYG